MKKLLITLSFMLAIIAFGIFESVFITNSFSYLEEKLMIASEYLKEDDENIDNERNISYMKNLHAEWQTKTSVLKFFVWHTGIKDVEVGLSRITSYTEENNYTEAYVELNNLIDYSQHYKEDYRFSIRI